MFLGDLFAIKTFEGDFNKKILKSEVSTHLLEHTPKPLPTGHKGIPFIVGQFSWTKTSLEFHGSFLSLPAFFPGVQKPRASGFRNVWVMGWWKNQMIFPPKFGSSSLENMMFGR